MKPISETSAIDKLAAIREGFRASVAVFEQRAESCQTCVTPGACCLDAHFVNVRITRLETAAIANALGSLPIDLKDRVRSRLEKAIADHKLDEVLDNSTATYACPLFEKGTGCLVHDTAKPLPCIAHACYKRESDLPPDELLDAAEIKVESLNRRTYGQTTELLSIPVALRDRKI